MDQACGMRVDRQGLTCWVKALRTGDTLFVSKLDRLVLEMRNLINTVHSLTGRGIGFKLLTGHGAPID
ncbi:recombinase family protein, partial [Pseudomonas sihuiensis]